MTSMWLKSQCKNKARLLCPTLCDPMDCSPLGSSVGFSRQGYWSGLPFPSPGDLPNPGIEPRCPALWADSLLTELWGKHFSFFSQYVIKDTIKKRSKTVLIMGNQEAIYTSRLEAAPLAVNQLPGISQPCMRISLWTNDWDHLYIF